MLTRRNCFSFNGLPILIAILSTTQGCTTNNTLSTLPKQNLVNTPQQTSKPIQSPNIPTQKPIIPSQNSNSNSSNNQAPVLAARPPIPAPKPIKELSPKRTLPIKEPLAFKAKPTKPITQGQSQSQNQSQSQSQAQNRVQNRVQNQSQNKKQTSNSPNKAIEVNLSGIYSGNPNQLFLALTTAISKCGLSVSAINTAQMTISAYGFSQNQSTYNLIYKIEAISPQKMKVKVISNSGALPFSLQKQVETSLKQSGVVLDSYTKI